eukprot:14586-Alexandrium_andersonii.AAC.1
MSASLVGSEMCIRDRSWCTRSLSCLGLASEQQSEGTIPQGNGGSTHARVRSCVRLRAFARVCACMRACMRP